jgi:UDP-2-acetamido-3-amino-2,3-dideoxy-glucuronate N-acetyltransferase
MRVSILGAGGWGQNLVRVFCELLGDEHVLVCDPREARRTAMKTEHPGIRVSEGPVFEGIDAVVIAAPAVAHAELARKALAVGRHVLVEKPIALTARDAAELVELAKEKGTILMVDHLLEYHPAVRELKRLVEERRLGRLLHLSSERLNLGVIRTEENALWSLAPHDISVILYLLGEEPSEVAAHGAAYLQPGIEDVAFVTLRFPSGAVGHVHVSWLDPVKTRRLTVVGEEKMAVFDDSEKQAQLFLHDARAEHVEGLLRPRRGGVESLPIPKGEPLRAMAETFLESVRTGTPPPSDGEDGLRVVRVLEAAARSMKEGGKPVQTKASEDKGYFVHPSSYVDDGVTIGRGTKIWHFSHVMRGTTIGEGTSVGQNVLIGPNVTVGSNVKIQNNVSVYEGVTLEDDVFCGPSSVFTNVYRPRSGFPTDHSKYRKTLIRRGATIGANATVVCGHSLGEHSFVGAGSVVTKDVPAYAIVYGNPARIHGWACQCGQPLGFSDGKAVCADCRRRYSLADGRAQLDEPSGSM